MSKTVTGKFLYANGAPIANGSVSFAAKIGANNLGTANIAPPQFEAPLAADGSFSLSMLGSDEGTPLFGYKMVVYNSAGSVVSISDSVLVAGANPSINDVVPNQNAGTAFPPQYIGGGNLKTIVGSFKNSFGAGVANGTATFTLSQSAALKDGSARVVPTPISVQLDANGYITGGANFQLYGNDAMEPYTVYLLVVTDSQNNQIYKGTVSLSGLAPISISQLISGPTSVSSSSIPNSLWTAFNWQKIVESLVSPTSWDFTGAPGFTSKNVWNTGVLEGNFQCTAQIGAATGLSFKVTSFSLLSSNQVILYLEGTNNQIAIGDIFILTNMPPDTGAFLNGIPLVATACNPGSSASSSYFVADFNHVDVPLTQLGATQGTATVTYLDVAAITAWSLTSNVVTFTAANDFVAGAPVLVTGLVAGSFLNNRALTVLSSGLSSSQFKCNFTASNASATEYGQAQSNVLPDLTLAWTDPVLGAQTQLLFSQTAAITQWTVTNNSITFFGSNSYVPGQMVAISGLTTGSAFNGLVLPVTSVFGNTDEFVKGLAVLFVCQLSDSSHNGDSATESGSAIALTPPVGTATLTFGYPVASIGSSPEFAANTNIALEIGTNEVGASLQWAVSVGLNYLGQ